MKKVTVGFVGSGFAATLHATSYPKVHGLDVRMKAVASTSANAGKFAAQHGIPDVYRDLNDLLADPEIDAVDICTPPVFHRDMVEEALKAGKHVICEKPLTGYCGRSGDQSPIGRHVPKQAMYEYLMDSLERNKQLVNASGKLFCYAENWVYAPTVRKAVEIIHAAKPKLLVIKGEESHSGSHALHAAQWDKTGGGALIRQGCHPLSAVLYLKQEEAKARGEKIAMDSVTADVGEIISHLASQDLRHIAARPVDVEDWAQMTVTFSDETKALVQAGDLILGGVRNLVEIYTSQGVMHCNIAPNTHMLNYSAGGQGLENVYITEKVETKLGWQFVCIDEEVTRGYIGELQDFMECVAYGRQPLSGYDLAYDTVKATYAAYWAAEAGIRVKV
jgi:predicted dehydrogenase